VKNVSAFDQTYLDWMRREADSGSPMVPAATVVLLRDAPDHGGLEVLMLRRNAAVEFAGGMWVFPGGRIDPEDHDGAADLLEAARNASVREAHEEAGQVVDVDSLVWFAHWCPPPNAPKRFATFFFACRALADEVTIDGSEIHDHEWMTPVAALERQRAKEVQLAPPTWITLHYLCRAGTVDAALAAFAAREPRFYETRMAKDDHYLYFLWQGDAAYPDRPVDTPGPRHRVVVRDDGWELDDGALPF
jgi:8-oxo-dGTP pyrophosphatase MutT (NUDIX family)